MCSCHDSAFFGAICQQPADTCFGCVCVCVCVSWWEQWLPTSSAAISRVSLSPPSNVTTEYAEQCLTDIGSIFAPPSRELASCVLIHPLLFLSM